MRLRDRLGRRYSPVMTVVGHGVPVLPRLRNRRNGVSRQRTRPRSSVRSALRVIGPVVADVESGTAECLPRRRCRARPAARRSPRATSGTNLLGRCASPSTKVFSACSTGCLVSCRGDRGPGVGVRPRPVEALLQPGEVVDDGRLLGRIGDRVRQCDVDEVAGEDVLGVHHGGRAVGVRGDDRVAVGGQRVDLVRPAGRPARHWSTAAPPRCHAQVRPGLLAAP